MRDDLDIPLPMSGAAPIGAYGQGGYRSAGRMDPNTKRLLIIAGGIGGALVVLMGAWSLTGHKNAGLPVIQADSRPVRERPVNKGGLQVSGADDTILSGEAEGRAVVAPAPEQPSIAALKATPPEPKPAEPAASTLAAPLPPIPSAPAAVAARTGLPDTPPRPVPAPRVAAASSAAPAVVIKPTVPSQATAPALGASKPGVAQVQLAAVDTEEAAKGEWARLSRKYPELLASRHPAFMRAERDGHVFWRIRVNGFADPASASSFCGQLKSKGGACALASS